MSSSEDDNVNIIPMENFASDGDMSTWPGGQYTERSDLRWRQLLAENWLKEMGTYEEGELTTNISGYIVSSMLAALYCIVLRVAFVG